MVQLDYISPSDLLNNTAPVEWLLKPYVARGAMTELTGAKKEAGKSTFLFTLIRQMVEGGGRMLGWEIKPGRVVYLTEQTPSSLREQVIKEAGISSDDMIILPYQHVVGRDWSIVAKKAVADAIELGADMLVVDTLPHFALKGGVDEENSSSAAVASLRPLQAACAAGIAVVVVRHTRKAGGSVGQAGRGSDAYGGVVDIMMMLRRGGGKSTRRVVEALGRYGDIPEKLIVEKTEDTYIVADGKYKPTREEKVFKLLPATMTELQDATGIPRTSLRRILADLVENGQVLVGGEEGAQIWTPSS